MAAVTNAAGCVGAALAAFGIALAAPMAAAKGISEEDAKSAALQVIAERSRDGVFAFEDAATGDRLALVLDDVRVVRGLPGYGWFPNVIFHDAAEPKKKYALDFWLKPQGDRARLLAIRVHKAPQPDGDSWMSITRPPLPWWWLPTIERSSSTAGLHAWQVMGSIHTKIAEAPAGNELLPRNAGGDAPQLIDVLQPVGRAKADGRYFACVAFRASDTEPGMFSADYWLEPKSGTVTLGSLVPMPPASTGNAKAAPEPRCDVKGVAFDVID